MSEVVEGKGAPQGFPLTTGGGTLGTGIYLAWPRVDTAEEKIADVWVTILFLPVVPLGTWVLERARDADAAWRVRGITSPGWSKSALTIVTFYLGAVLALLPGYLTLEFSMGRQLVGLTGLLGSAGLSVGSLAWLDSTRPRLPLRALRGAWSRSGGG